MRVEFYNQTLCVLYNTHVVYIWLTNWGPRRSALVPQNRFWHIDPMYLIIGLSPERAGRFWLARPPALKWRISQRHAILGSPHENSNQHTHLIIPNPRLYGLAKCIGLTGMVTKEFAQITASIARVQVFEEVEYTINKVIVTRSRSDSPTVRRWRPPSPVLEV